ncbi:hypothetical protein [Flexistipes sp.]|uniref:hypothetical protein n=1 Tax=Flexistipes sp. TaxID=3088135 RepID=UPI002E1A5BB2|nr:hypothetical protein [Flexistipes sp.]
MKLFTTYLLIWLGMIPLAVFNGIIREKIIGRFSGELKSHQLSTILLIIIFAVYTLALGYFAPVLSLLPAVSIGLMWAVLTITFEFLFGHFVAKIPFSKLLNDYNLFKGRIWILIPIWLFILPIILYYFYR